MQIRAEFVGVDGILVRREIFAIRRDASKR
jgi:hypothetical protein